MRVEVTPEAIKRRAGELFSQMRTEDRWAYWSDECELGDIFECQIPAPVRRKVCEMVNTWAANPDNIQP